MISRGSHSRLGGLDGGGRDWSSLSASDEGTQRSAVVPGREGEDGTRDAASGGAEAAGTSVRRVPKGVET